MCAIKLRIMHNTPENNHPELPMDTLPFREYRSICDGNSVAYRPVGITDEDKYKAALEDSDTVLATLANGIVMPAFVPLDYTDGYDVPRTRALTGCDRVFLLAAPTSVIDGEIDLNSLKGGAVIVESEHSRSADDAGNLQHLFQANGMSLENGTFLDPRIEDRDYQSAFMALYGGEAYVTEGMTDPRITSLREAFTQTGLEIVPYEGLTLFDAEQLRAHPEVASQLWDLFKDRFEWLGDYHPVSMEDTQEVFESIIFSESTFVPMRFSEGKLVCAGIIMHQIEECPWIRQTTFDQIYGQDHGKGLTPMYFFGIAAYRDKKAIKNMEEVVHFHCKLAASAGINYRVLFESSNMSSLYIPSVTADYINSSGCVSLKSGIEKIAQQDYWYLKPL